MAVRNYQKVRFCSVYQHFHIDAYTCSKLDFKLLSSQQEKPKQQKRCILAVTVVEAESKTPYFLVTVKLWLNS